MVPENSTGGLQTIYDPTADYLAPQENTNQALARAGEDVESGARLPCTGGRAVVEIACLPVVEKED